MALRYLSADQLLADSQALAVQIVQAGFFPDLLVALWRGGAPVGLAIHEVLVFAGHRCEHLPISAESYHGINQHSETRFSGLAQLQSLLPGCQRILLVDDVFDSGRTMQALIQRIHALQPDQSPELRIATPWYKPGQNQTTLVPHFHLHTTEDWLVFPHELQDLSDAELLAKPGQPALLQQLLALRKQTPEPPR